MRTLYLGEHLPRSLLSLHRRIPCKCGERTLEPPTYWLTLTLPFRMRLRPKELAGTRMSEVRDYPRLSVGLRFRVGT